MSLIRVIQASELLFFVLKALQGPFEVIPDSTGLGMHMQILGIVPSQPVFANTSSIMKRASFFFSMLLLILYPGAVLFMLVITTTYKSSIATL